MDIAADSHTQDTAGGARAALGLLGWVALSYAAALGGIFAGPGDWYDSLRKPAFNPPGWVFGPVWTLLYAMMGTSAWLVWRRGGFKHAGTALGLFILQLVLNAAWTPLFFGLKAPGVALVVIIALWLAILATAIAFMGRSRLAALLLLPYLLWVSYATLLNGSLWYLNS
ncbi:MAG: tryptophan-rich sensory protein [Planctomycetes bacterium]|nr:tryptophan-rich sensory protein [Planctomycetota bacterium]